MSVFAFYGGLIRKTPEAFRGAWDTVFWVAAVAVALLTSLNRQVGKEIVESWEGVSPWWTLATVAVFAIARMAVNNYEAFRALEQRTETVEAARARRTELRMRLTRLISEAKFYEKKCLEKSEPTGLRIQFEEWEKDAHNFFMHEFGDESYCHLLFTATVVDGSISAEERECFAEDDGQYMFWLRTLRAKRAVVEGCLTHFPPSAARLG